MSRDLIGELVRLADPPSDAAPGCADRVQLAARAAWHTTVRRRRRRRLFVAGGIVAAAAAAWAALSITLVRAPAPVERPATVARVTVSSGVVDARVTQSRAPLIVGSDVAAGTIVDTGRDGRAAFAFAGGESVRVDRDTQVRFVAPGTLDLTKGAIYLDSDRARGHTETLEIRTSFGVVRDVGTQFEVRVLDNLLRVRVREGSVNLERRRIVHSAGVGVELRVREDGGASRRTIDISGPDWAWVENAAPPFVLEGQPLASYLRWIARETGLKVRFTDRAAEQHAARTVLHGAIDGVSPTESLGLVLPPSGATYQSRAGTLVIGWNPPPAGR